MIYVGKRKIHSFYRPYQPPQTLSSENKSIQQEKKIKELVKQLLPVDRLDAALFLIWKNNLDPLKRDQVVTNLQEVLLPKQYELILERDTCWRGTRIDGEQFLIEAQRRADVEKRRAVEEKIKADAKRKVEKLLQSVENECPRVEYPIAPAEVIDVDQEQEDDLVLIEDLTEGEIRRLIRPSRNRNDEEEDEALLKKASKRAEKRSLSTTSSFASLKRTLFVFADKRHPASRIKSAFENILSIQSPLEEDKLELCMRIVQRENLNSQDVFSLKKELLVCLSPRDHKFVHDVFERLQGYDGNLSPGDQFLISLRIKELASKMGFAVM